MSETMKVSDTILADDSTGNACSFTVAESAVDAVINTLRSETDSTNPHADTDPLLQADSGMAIIASAQKLFSSILAHRMASLGRQHNSLLPINKLPTELVAQILSLAIFSHTWRISTLSTLASVCVRWWRIIINTPSFWAVARMGEKPDLAAKKSKDRSLVVEIVDGSHRHWEMKQFADVVGPQAHRWRFVYLRSPYVRDLFGYLGGPLPRLEELAIGLANRRLFEERPAHLLSLGHAPRLRHLHLDQVSMDWDAVARMSLKTLWLLSLYHRIPRMAQLHQILVSNAQLTNLKLVNLPDLVGAEAFNADPTHLSNLREVVIQDTGVHTIVGLAKTLQAPRLSLLNLAIGIRPDFGVSRFRCILRPGPKDSLLPSTIRNLGLQTVYVKITFTDFKLSDQPTFDKSSGRLFIEIQGILGSEPLLLLGPPDRGYDVDLDVSECVLRDDELTRVLGLIDPSSLRIGRHHLPSVMKALPKAPTSSGAPWFCPNLKVLRVTTVAVDPNETARVLRARNGLGQMESPAGRSKLSIYDGNGRVFDPNSMSFKSKSRHSHGQPQPQNV